MAGIEAPVALLLCIALSACAAEKQPVASPAAKTTEATADDAAAPITAPAPLPAEAIAPTSADPLIAPSAADARQAVIDYYASINSRDYRKAYLLWSGDGAASQQSFEDFSGGYANTESVEVDAGEATGEEGAAGSRYITVPVQLRAHQYNGALHRFRGRFALRAVVADGASDEQRRWHLHSAEIQRIP